MRRAAVIAFLTLACTVGQAQGEARAGDDLSCAAPFELQRVRDLDFGRIVMSKGQGGQVDLHPDGGYRQLGGAYVTLAAAPAELGFCGPPGRRFEIRIEAVSVEGAATIQLAPGSVSLVAQGAEVSRLNTSLWEGVIGTGGRVALRFGGRLDIGPDAASTRATLRLAVSLRSR